MYEKKAFLDFLKTFHRVALEAVTLLTPINVPLTRPQLKTTHAAIHKFSAVIVKAAETLKAFRKQLQNEWKY